MDYEDVVKRVSLFSYETSFVHEEGSKTLLPSLKSTII